MWEISNSSQLNSLLYSIAFGAIICIFYDILRATRFVFKFKNITIFLQDLFFFIFLAISIFSFLLVTTNGQLRGYIILGVVIGFSVCRLTISIAIVLVLKFFFIKILRFFDLLKIVFIKILKKPLIFCKKSCFLFKKLLKK
ncbi:MAG: spore cortex biosynthesis protein YabQ [Clostridia bacterium]|nr:spore cortex biosynthesis protein YabQ [Clostridia bacterium]